MAVQPEEQNNSSPWIIRIFTSKIAWLVGFVLVVGVLTPIVQELMKPISQSAVEVIRGEASIEQVMPTIMSDVLRDVSTRFPTGLPVAIFPATHSPTDNSIPAIDAPSPFATDPPTVAITAAPTPTDRVYCGLAPAPRLLPGDEAIQVGAQVIRIRSEPGLGAAEIGRVQRQARVVVVNGPRCVDGYQWFKVITDGGQQGWVAEADNKDSKEYWLVKAVTDTDTPIPTDRPTATHTDTAVPTDTAAPKRTDPPTATVQPAATSAATSTSTIAPSAIPSTPTDRPTATHTDKAVPTDTAAPKRTDPPTATVQPAATSAATSTSTIAPSAIPSTPTDRPTATHTDTAVPTDPPTPQPTDPPTATKKPAIATDTPMADSVSTSAPSPIPAAPTETPAAIDTATLLPTQTSTPTFTITPVPTKRPTVTFSATPLPTDTPTATLTSTPLPTDTPTATHTISPCRFTPASQLRTGNTAIQLGAAFINLRSEPGLRASVIARIRRFDTVRIANDGQCMNELYWYKVVTEQNIQGWVAEADNNAKVYWLVRAADAAVCTLEPRFAPGDTARSKPRRALNVRVNPDLSAGETDRDIDGGESVEVLEGPVCADGFIWYKVLNDALGIAGWVAEGGTSGYWFYAPERLR